MLIYHQSNLTKIDRERKTFVETVLKLPHKSSESSWHLKPFGDWVWKRNRM